MGNFFGRIVGRYSLSRSTTKVSSSGCASGISSSPSTSVSNSTRNEHTVHLPSSSESIEDFYGNGEVLPTPKLRIFTFVELKSATRNFKPDTVLGEGGFGKVYKGWVDERTMNPVRSGNGMMVAVKKMNKESVQGLQEWQSEIDFLGWLSHPNLVRLLGYCWEGSELLLVYEFMAKGSLDNHLFKKDRFHETLSWNLRLKIAIGAARGLECLHSSEKQIIYRDLKAANILLDSDYNAKLSDFGLAKHGPAAGETHVTTHPKGTYGYAAPEYLSTGHLSIRSDVYGFGVVLLEILSGEKAFDLQRPSRQYSLIDWAKPHLGNRKNIRHIMDQRLEGQYPPKAASQVAELAQKCFATSPKSRPTMKEVVESLEKINTMSGDTANSPAATLLEARGHGQTPPRYRSPRHAM